MDHLPRLIRYLGAMVALLACAFPASAQYVGPDQDVTYFWHSWGFPQPAECASAPLMTLAGVSSCMAGWCAVNWEGGQCYLSMGGQQVPYTGPAPDSMGDTLHINLTAGGTEYGSAGQAAIGVAGCPEGLAAIHNEQGVTRCRSVCAPKTGQEVTVYIAIQNASDSVANSCLTVNSQSCEITVVNAVNLTSDGILYRVGTYAYSGSSCVESANPPSTNATLGEPTGGSSGGGGLDAADKANLEAIKGNTGATGAVAELLEQIKAQGQAKATSTSSTVDCAQDFTCTGDAIRCAEVTYARKAYCDSKVPVEGTLADASALVDVMKGETDATRRSSLSKGTVDVSAGINRPRFLTAAACPTPEQVTLNFGPVAKTFEVGFEPLCDLANIISFFLIFSSSVIGVRLFFGGLG